MASRIIGTPSDYTKLLFCEDLKFACEIFHVVYMLEKIYELRVALDDEA